MQYLYTLGIYLLGGFYRLAALFVPKARKWHQGRKGWEGSLQEGLEDWPAAGPRVWIHCASLGEFEQGRPLIEQIRKEQAQTRILLSFFSPSGYEIRKDYSEADLVCYLPLDTPANARRFLELVRPDLGIFVKYEFWFNYIAYAKKRDIPLVLIAGLFREGQYFFRPFGKWFQTQLASFRHFYVQDLASANLLRSKGIKQVSVVGDPRVDRVLQIATQVKNFPKIKEWQGDRPTLVVGSSWPADEVHLYDFFAKALPNNWCVLLAPHDISATHIQQICDKLPLSYQKYSDWTEQEIQPTRVLVIDNIGMLSSLYKFGRIAYIGGGFGGGIHNTLEPMAFGLPLLFGPRYEKFTEARQTVAEGGAFAIDNAADIQRSFEQLQQVSNYKKSSTVVKQYLDKSRNATRKIWQHLRAQDLL